MRRRDTLLIVLAAILIAVLAWVFLARGHSDAPEEAPGANAMPLHHLSLSSPIAQWGLS